MTEPTPVVTAHPINAAFSSGMSSRILTTLLSGKTISEA
jgi:hypothetical protein